MANFVKVFPPRVPDSSIKSGLLVRSSDWSDIAQYHNWLTGRGGQLICGCAPNLAVGSGATDTFRFYVRPRHAHWHRLWYIWVLPVVSDSRVSVKSILPLAGSAQVYRVSSENQSKLLKYSFANSSPNETEAEAAIEIAVATGGAIRVHNIACFEVPRVQLDALATDYGANENTVQRGNIIYDGEADLRSATGIVHVAEHVGGKRTGNAMLRRHGYFWSVDDSDAKQTSLTSFQNMQSTAKPQLLGRIYNSGQTAKRYKVRVRATNSGPVETGGQVKFTMTSGATATITVSSTSFAWTSAVDLQPDCEDLAASDGRRSSRHDEVTIQFKAEAGKSISVSAIAIYDAGDVT